MELDPAVIGVTVSVVVAVGAFFLYLVRGEISRASKERQPRNGGSGWLDVHHKLDTVIERQAEVVEDVRYLRARVDRHIEGHDHHNPTGLYRRKTDN